MSNYANEIEKIDAESADDLMTTHFKKILRPGATVVDVGANAGQFAEFVIRTQPEVSVFALEPQQKPFDRLKRLAQFPPASARIIANRYAVSPTNGETSFNVNVSDVGSSLLKPLPGQPSKWLTPDTTEVVPTIRLDKFFTEMDIKEVDLLKSDAQGFDAEVLRSAGEFMNPEFVKAVLVEMNYFEFYEGQGTVDELFKDLSAYGYRLAAFYPHRNYEGWLWWADGLFLPK